MKPQGQRLVHLQFAVSSRVGFSRQKLKLVAKLRDDFLRAQFSYDVAMYKPEMLILLDETGSDKRNTLMVTVYEANLQYPRSFWCVENVSQRLHLCQCVVCLISR